MRPARPDVTHRCQALAPLREEGGASPPGPQGAPPGTRPASGIRTAPARRAPPPAAALRVGTSAVASPGARPPSGAPGRRRGRRPRPPPLDGRIRRVGRPRGPRRHVAPDHGLPEGAGAGNERWRGRERAAHRRAAPACAGQRRDPAAAVGEDLDGARPQADRDPTRSPSS